MKSIIIFICFTTSAVTELINWKFKPKQFLQIGTSFERKCETNRPLEIDEQISWILYYHDGRMNIIHKSNLVINSFTVRNEGIAICQIRHTNRNIIDEKYFFITSDPTELIDDRFEGYDQALIDTDMDNRERHCGVDENIDYMKGDVADFHIDFVQHYERIRQHSNHIQLKNVKHENEGHYECIVRLHNGLVGIRVFFLSVGGDPRQLINRETQIYSEINDSITLLCPIFSAVPAWFTFILPQDSVKDVSPLTGYDYLRIKNVSDAHTGMYACRVTTNDNNEGYSLTSNLYLNVYSPPEYVDTHKNEYVSISIERNLETLLHCSIDGNPKPNYQWFLGDKTTIEESAVVSNRIDYIIIPNNNDAPGSNQTVTCIARNNRGSKRQVFTLQLLN